jgi:exodeoxyribonuclease V alpha subunit
VRIALAAPTGKAAARLGESLQGIGKRLDLPEDVVERMPTSAVTLHRLLGWIAGSPRFRHDRDNPLNIDLLVLDEVSMVDLPLMAKTVQALPTHARLLLLGDRDQLASVEAGAVLGDICGGDRLEVFSSSFVRDYARTVGAGNNPKEPLPRQGQGTGLVDAVVPLTKSYRFGEKSGIKRLSLAVPGLSLSSQRNWPTSPGSTPETQTTCQRLSNPWSRRDFCLPLPRTTS